METGNAEMARVLEADGAIRTARVRNAFLAVDRGIFTSASHLAYAPTPLPTQAGQTISAPSVVAIMLELLDVKEGMKVLEVGTGSGYNTALLSELVGKTGKVITIERYSGLVEIARANLARAGKGMEAEIVFVTGDGSCGFPEYAPYDRIIVTAAMPKLDEKHPMALQLKQDGKLVAPIGDVYSQLLTLYEKKANRFQTGIPVIFVPVVGKCGFTDTPAGVD